MACNNPPYLKVSVSVYFIIPSTVFHFLNYVIHNTKQKRLSLLTKKDVILVLSLMSSTPTGINHSTTAVQLANTSNSSQTDQQ